MADSTDNANEGTQQGHGTEIPDPHDESAEDTGSDSEPVGTPADADQQEQIADLLSEHGPNGEEESQEKSLDDVLDSGEEEDTSQDQEEIQEEPQRQGRDEGAEEPEQRREEQEEPDTDQAGSDELDELREELRETKKELARMKQEGEEGEGEGEEDEEEPVETQEEGPRDFDEVDFVTEDEFEEVTEDPDSFNEFLQAFASSIKESVLRDIPGIVEKTTQRQVTYQQAISDFWDEHPELEEHQDFVQFTANKVEAENPDMSVPEMLDETARQAKEELAIKEEAEQRESQREEGEAGSQSTSQSRSPSTARKPRGSRGGVGGEDNRGEQQQQIDSLISDDL